MDKDLLQATDVASHPPSLKSDIIKYILGGATKLYSRKNLVPLYERSLILNILVIVKTLGTFNQEKAPTRPFKTLLRHYNN